MELLQSCTRPSRYPVIFLIQYKTQCDSYSHGIFFNDLCAPGGDWDLIKYDPLISTMGFPILVKQHLYVESLLICLSWWGEHPMTQPNEDSILHYNGKDPVQLSSWTCLQAVRSVVTLTHCVAKWCHMVTLIWVNIGSGNGLLPDGTKPLPEPMLTYHQWGNVAEQKVLKNPV